MAVRKGFTLIEFLIGTSIGIVIIGALVSFFFYGHTIVLNKSSPEKRKMIFVFQVMEIINSDLRKAGYGIKNQTMDNQTPVVTELKKITVRYVDYEKDLNGDGIPDCENETFKDDKKKKCDYVVVYEFKKNKNNLYRRVDREADGNFTKPMPMFDESIIEIDNFTVKIDNNTHVVKYVIKGRIKGRESSNFTIEDAIICRNWHH